MYTCVMIIVENVERQTFYYMLICKFTNFDKSKWEEIKQHAVLVISCLSNEQKSYLKRDEKNVKEIRSIKSWGIQNLF